MAQEPLGPGETFVSCDSRSPGNGIAPPPARREGNHGIGASGMGLPKSMSQVVAPATVDRLLGGTRP